MDDEELRADIAKVLQQLRLEDADRTYWTAYSAIGALYRWILASLVTLNGGAIVALAGWQGPRDQQALAAAAGWFFSGCALAVTSALAGAAFMLSVSTEALVQRHALRGNKAAQGKKARHWGATILHLAASGFAGASLAAFILGGMAVSRNLQTPRPQAELSQDHLLSAGNLSSAAKPREGPTTMESSGEQDARITVTGSR